MTRTIRYQLRSVSFEWDVAKATSNELKHGIPFESACEVFFDPFMRIVDDVEVDEARYAAIGYAKSRQLLFVVHLYRHEEVTRIVFMKNPERIARRMRKDRPMVAVTLRMPMDVVEDLKCVAPALGYSGYQPLIRAYVGRGLREDLEQLENSSLASLVENLRRRGVTEAVLAEAIAEATKASNTSSTR